jgi:hypothetical protein
MPRWYRGAWLVVSILVLATEASASEEPAWKLAVHGGWWDVGIDTTSPGGLLAGVGVPWVPLLPVLAYSGQKGVLALDTRVGYAHALSSRTTLYAELLTAWVYDWGDPCGDGCDVHTHRLFFLPGLGLRHRFGDRSGWMIGADVPLVLLQVHHDDDPDHGGWRRKTTPPWVGAAFSQAYVGYEWGL